MNRQPIIALFLFVTLALVAQTPVSVGGGSYASYVPLTKSRTSEHEGCQAYQMEHRKLYVPDSLLARLGAANGSVQGTMALPTNDWWTHALVNEWTGKIWMYPGWVEATQDGIDIGYPDHWEPTGNEVKWDTPLHVSLKATHADRPNPKMDCLVDNWSDFMMSFIIVCGEDWLRVTCVHGSPLIWFESKGMQMTVANPDAAKYWTQEATGQDKQWLVVGLKTDGLTDETLTTYATRVPRSTTMTYAYDAEHSSLSTTFSLTTENIATGARSATAPCLMAFLPHHYYEPSVIDFQLSDSHYLSPRGQMRLAEGNDFSISYPVHSFLPYFPAPLEWNEEFSATRMAELNADYSKRGTFGGDTYWGGKGLTQMAHYMTFALQMGDTATFRMAKQRLKDVLIDWYTYTPGEQRYYFARYPRWGALIGMDPSYDSETFNDHHFHYGYFIYSSAVLCMLDDDFRIQYGPMAREVARDYANWQHSADEPWFRTLDPYCGHSFAGGLGNAGNGNGQESTSEAIQGWGGVWMLGAALQDQEMLEAGIMGYTLETRATSEYWFDKKRRNIDFTKYQHPYCCNLTMQGVGWWTWFSGDPVWMHSIQWLPISPILTNCFSEDLAFTRWDYTQMYAAKEVGNYEAETNGLGDESGLGNVCLSYLSLFDADSAINVWSRMDAMGKPLAKNPDTGGITYWLAHSHKALGEKRYDIYANHPLACVYTDTLSGRMTYAVFNVGQTPLSVHFFGAKDTTVTVPHGLTLISGAHSQTITTIEDEADAVEPDPMAWNLPYPNLALHKPVAVSSEENAGCLAVNLTDGKETTRWGSIHQDNEYAIVDLEQMCYIDYMILRWETAYASEYELAFSDDNSTWRTSMHSSAGGVEKVDTRVRARYIRLKGTQRATQYGTSLYELEAYGRPLSGDPTKVFAIALSATDTVLYQGQSTVLTTTAYNVNGEEMTSTAAYTITNGIAQLNGNTVTCPNYGTVTVQARVDDCVASLTLVVLETEQLDSVVVYPAEVTMPAGDTQRFEVCPINQFGMTIDTCHYDFRATQVGDTTLTFDCYELSATAVAHVLPYSDVNLALEKPVTESGHENAGTVPENAVDGKQDTRWGSRFNDDEWLEIDLLHCYQLDSIRIYWETAYATEYEIQVSQDAIFYETAYSTTNAKGGKVTHPIQVSGRYVRLICHKRSTGYGSSLYEIEVYGSGRCDDIETAIDNHITPTTNYKFIKDGQMYISHNGVVYTVSGLVFMHTKE